jgi:hypothetical protein
MHVKEIYVIFIHLFDSGILPKVSEVPSVTPQPMPQSSKKRHAQGRGEQDMNHQ